MRALPSTHCGARAGIAAAALSCVLLLAGAAACGDAGRSGDAGDTGAAISPSELASRIEAGDAPLILDVRTPEEYADGHLPGARNIPYDALSERLGELDVAKDEEIVVHCHSGRRAGVAEQVLRDAGYENVRDLSGHWQEWKKADLPTE